ncbi:MAG: hypothetical protein DCC52_14115, partial [Chloroflexi bacterium]
CNCRSDIHRLAYFLEFLICDLRFTVGALNYTRPRAAPKTARGQPANVIKFKNNDNAPRLE